ncbi:hypothetical protein QQ045_020030 [Rhodiola kirilowii]
MDAPKGQRSSSSSTAYVGSLHINRQYSHKLPRESSEDLGKTHFRQNKLITPPWMPMQAGFVQINPRYILCKREVGIFHMASETITLKIVAVEWKLPVIVFIRITSLGIIVNIHLVPRDIGFLF